ncbi:Sugar phosphate isomerase/epimerase [Priestia aryabhattai B8W22]|uniref:sugar phosphate isomerase/epimerase family protein n=1 Tax=Priestia aryabhattai TaxID=412384 RepID=UPI00088A3058|nr:Sugar phosphate isomerase/epimerase [Priestia aryabhattai B8W22]
MLKTLHGISVNHSNVLTQTRIAHETGYDAVEFLHNKLLRYLDNGGTTKALKNTIDGYGLKTACLNALIDIERHGEEKQALLRDAERLTSVAAELECPTIQILAQHGIDHESDDIVMDIMTENIASIADIGLKYGVRYQIEVIAHTKFNTIDQALEVIRRINKGNVGLVIDFWHMYATGKTTPDDVAKLDKSLIYGVHFCDGRRPYSGEAWNENVQRAYMPGEGNIDIQAYTDAVKSTGFDGAWSTELFSPKYWEYDLVDVARLCYENLTKYTG